MKWVHLDLLVLKEIRVEQELLGLKVHLVWREDRVHLDLLVNLVKKGK